MRGRRWEAGDWFGFFLSLGLFIVMPVGLMSVLVIAACDKPPATVDPPTDGTVRAKLQCVDGETGDPLPAVLTVGEQSLMCSEAGWTEPALFESTEIRVVGAAAGEICPVSPCIYQPVDEMIVLTGETVDVGPQRSADLLVGTVRFYKRSE